MENLRLESLERLSKNWDRRTAELSVYVDGSGNMFGGSSRHLHVIIHGENSINETGKIYILGLFVTSYNIARGANGADSCSTSYYKGLTDFAQITPQSIPTATCQIEGMCGGTQEAIAGNLGLISDYIIQ